MTKLREKWTKIPLGARSSSVYAICSIVQKCISIITLPLFTRLLTTAQYGQTTIYYSWQVILQIFLTLNLYAGSFSTAMVKFEDDRNGYISAVQGICVALSGLFLLIYLPFRNLWNQLFELPTWIMCIMVVELLCSTATSMWSSKKRFEYKYISVVSVTIAIAVLSPLLQYILVMTHEEKGFARIIGTAAVTVAVGGSFFAYNLFKGRKPFHKEYWKYALGFNIPLLAYYLSQIVFNLSDRIMISHMSGTDKAAVYSVAYSLAMVLNFVLNAINNSYVPWYYGKIKEGREEENKTVSLGIAALMAILLSGIVWFAPEIIRIMAGEQYTEAVWVMPPVAISLLLLFYAQLFINVEFYYEQKKKLVWASIGAALTNLVLNWIFIRIFGFVAAAYTTLVSYIIFAVSNYFTMKSVLKEKNLEDKAYNYKGLIFLFLGLCGLSAVGAALYGSLVARIAVAAVALAVLAVKRKMIMNLLQTIRRKGQST